MIWNANERYEYTTTRFEWNTEALFKLQFMYETYCSSFIVYNPLKNNGNRSRLFDILHPFSKYISFSRYLFIATISFAIMLLTLFRIQRVKCICRPFRFKMAIKTKFFNLLQKFNSTLIHLFSYFFWYQH